MKTLLFLISLFWVFVANSHEEPEGAPNVGAAKGVTEFNKQLGFKISDKAEKRLGIKFRKLQYGGPWSIEPESIVHLRNETGVYRRSNGWISYVVVKTDPKQKSMRSITSKHLHAGDEVAVHGAVFLRMIDSDLSTESAESDEDAREKGEEQ